MSCILVCCSVSPSSLLAVVGSTMTFNGAFSNQAGDVYTIEFQDPHLDTSTSKHSLFLNYSVVICIWSDVLNGSTGWRRLCSGWCCPGNMYGARFRHNFFKRSECVHVPLASAGMAHTFFKKLSGLTQLFLNSVHLYLRIPTLGYGTINRCSCSLLAGECHQGFQDVRIS